MNIKKLIFVYNANANVFSLLTDFAHKIISPKTYNCNLCLLTYGNITMKSEWRKFIESLSVEVDFLHKDEFHEQFEAQAQVELPAIFSVNCEEKIEQAISSEQINKATSIETLKTLIRAYLHK